MNRINILGIEFDNITLKDAISKAFSMLSETKMHYIVTPNSEIVYAARKDEAAQKVLNEADLVIPDGIGVVYASKILKRNLKEKVAGIDLAAGLMNEMAEANQRLFLFGSKPGIAEAAAENLKNKYPGLIVCGTHNGYFDDDSKVIEKINSSEPDVVFVCLGAPKQEVWMNKNKGKINAKLMIGLGGSLDVFAGIVERAPEAWTRLGLEWLYRLKKEPYRFWRMTALPKFMITVIFAGKKYK